MSDVADIVAALAVDRQRLRDVYERVRTEVAPGSQNFLNISKRLPDDIDLVATAVLTEAETEGWLEDLGQALLIDDLVDRETTGRTILQRMVRPNLAFLDTGTTMTGMIRCPQQVCLVDVDDGAGSGTGFLVGPHMVMTSWHVVAPLLTASGQPKPGSGRLLSVHFDRISNRRQSSDHRVEDDEWLLAASPCGLADLEELVGPEGIDAGLRLWLEGEERAGATLLDFAIVDLQDSPGQVRGWIELADAVVPQADRLPQLQILQHPGAHYQQLGNGEFMGWRDNQIRRTMLYTNNTASGSSGGLVVDHRYRFVGLHQGAAAPPSSNGSSSGNGSSNGTDNGDGSSSNGSGPADSAGSLNVGISGQAIARYLEDQPAMVERLQADDSKIFQHRRLRNTGPILGRKKCQDQLTRCRQGTAQVMSVFSRDPEEERPGKTFTYEIMKACLPDVDHVVAFVDADVELFGREASVGDLSDATDRSKQAVDPVDGAASLLRILGANGDGLPRPDGDTGAPTWIRETLCPVFIDRVNQHPRPDCQLWLVLDNIDKDRLRGSRIDVLIETVLQRIELMPRLRIVLLGYDGKPPGVSEDRHSREPIEGPSRQDIEWYLGNRYKTANIAVGPGEVDRMARLIQRSGGRRIAKLSDYVERVVDEMFQELAS